MPSISPIETGSTKKNILNDELLKVFLRLSKPDFSDEISIFGEKIKATNCQGNNPIFSLHGCESYIIIEKPSIKSTLINVKEEWNLDLKSSTPVSKKSKKIDLDVTGSPLPCHFKDISLNCTENEILEASLKDELKIFHGFDLSKAKELTSKFIATLTELKQVEKFLPPIWICCKEKNIEDIIFTGVWLTESDIITSLINDNGPTNPKILPNVDDIHAYFERGNAVMAPEMTKATATYIINDAFDNNSCVSAICTWKKPNLLLSLPNLSASTLIKVNRNVQKLDHDYLQKELCKIQLLIDTIDKKSLKWPLENNDKCVPKELENYISNTQNTIEMRRKNYQSKAVEDLKIILTNQNLQLRFNLDFVDEMWELLKNCQSVVELEESLEIIFKSVFDRTLKPLLHAKDETEFATICRDLMCRKIKTPKFQGQKAIELLIGIGLNKLKRDLVTAYLEWGLAILEQLSPIINWTPTPINFQQGFSNLQKLCNVLQVVFELISILNLPTSLCSQFVSESLPNFNDNKFQEFDYDFKIDTSLIQKLSTKLEVQTWTYEIRNKPIEENFIASKCSKLCLKADSPFFEVDGESFEDNLADLSISSEKTYYCLSVTSMGHMHYNA